MSFTYDLSEVRRCNVCGNDWEDTGDQECPFCASADTFIVNEDDEDESTMRKEEE